jgi:hypothetical protein
MKTFEEYHTNYNLFTFKPYDSYEIETPTNKILYYRVYDKIKEISGLYPYIIKHLDEIREFIKLDVIIQQPENEKLLFDKLIRIGNAFNVDFDMNLSSISELEADKILDKRLPNLYEPIFKKPISFDFDGVLHKSIIRGTIHPKNYNDYDNFEPNLEMINKINELSKNHSIVIITSRQNYEISSIWRFLHQNNVKIQEVFTTDGDRVKKSYILKTIKALQHYDDNIQIKNDVEQAGVVFQFVNTNIYFK